MIKSLKAKCRKILQHIRAGGHEPIDRLAVLIWAPACDEQTFETADWARRLKLPKTVHSQPLIGRVTRSDVETCLAKVHESEAIVVFLGHGTDDELIGHPFGMRNGIPAQSPVYDTDLIGIGPSALFAHCCYAGIGLGRAFANIPARSFLGFDDSIPIFVMNESGRRVWISVLQSIVDQIVKDKTITVSHFAALKERYNDVFRYYRTGKGRESEEGIFMAMYALELQEALVFRGE